MDKIGISKGSYTLVKDSFAVSHIVKITTYNDDSFGGIVVKSIEPSTLNTIRFSVEDVEFTFPEKPDLDKLEENYPEIWL